MLRRNNRRKHTDPQLALGGLTLPGEDSEETDAVEAPLAIPMRAAPDALKPTPLTYDQCLADAEREYTGMSPDGLLREWLRIREKSHGQGPSDTTTAALEVIERLMGENDAADPEGAQGG